MLISLSQTNHTHENSLVDNEHHVGLFPFSETEASILLTETSGTSLE